ncbi:MAG: hypothetical protein DA407_00475 [Bacteroidetes bacterium]|nr:MAG: hypothetical protein DA407_00475 [Bacteroidota bacterium]
MILTTTNSIEGHKIQDYLGIVTGTSSELKKSFSFKNDKNMQIIEELMNEAKEQAFQKLKVNASKLNANAVLAISVDIETAAGSYFFVSVTGTAVKVT